MPYQFRADPRNGFDAALLNPCEISCCCQQLTFVPGETNGITINYLPWVAPLGGRGLTNPTQVTITKLTADASAAPSVAPTTGPTPLAASADGLVVIPQGRLQIRGFLLAFPIAVDADATVGDVYRMNVRQAAMDCDTNFFWHVSCYDLTIQKC